MADPRPAAADDTATWLPVFCGWEIGNRDRRRIGRRLQEGLQSVGVDARIDLLGEPPLQFEMLRVRTPQVRLEAQESWLLQLAPRHDDDENHDEDDPRRWAGDLDCVLQQRWPQWLLWHGSGAACRRLEPRLRHPEPSPRAFVGHRYTLAVGHSGQRSLEAFARSSAAMALRLPRVAWRGAGVDGDPEAWVALASVPISDRQSLANASDKLAAAGLCTACCAIPDGDDPRALLFVHDGGMDLEQLDDRLAAAGAGPGLRIRWPMIDVHRCRSSQAEALRDRLQAGLPGAVLAAEWHPQHEDLGRILVAVHQVDRVLARLRFHLLAQSAAHETSSVAGMPASRSDYAWCTIARA